MTFVGKKTVPRALRKDHWRPLAHVTFSNEQSGIQTFHYLREYRKMHETAYDPSILKTTSHFERKKLLMDQRANAIADLAESLKKTNDERIEILWDDIYDAEYAEKWPSNVLHDIMEGSANVNLGEGIKRNEGDKSADTSSPASKKKPHYIIPQAASEAETEESTHESRKRYHLSRLSQPNPGPVTLFQYYSRMVKQTRTKISVVQEEAAKRTEWARRKIEAGYVTKLERMLKLYSLGVRLSKRSAVKGLPEARQAELDRLREELTGKNWLAESEQEPNFESTP